MSAFCNVTLALLSFLLAGIYDFGANIFPKNKVKNNALQKKLRTVLLRRTTIKLLKNERIFFPSRQFYDCKYVVSCFFAVLNSDDGIESVIKVL